LIDHSRKATRFAFGMSKFFTNLARMNGNTFGSVDDEFKNNVWVVSQPYITPSVEEVRFYFK